MSFSLLQILLCIIAYLGMLFTVALLAHRGIIPERISRHPAVYVLSLGVFAGALATNGIFSFVAEYRSGFLMYYLGIAVMFLLTPLLLLPLLRLSRIYQLASLADLLTFRFRSQPVGTAVTVAMSLTLLPLLAMQIQAVADSIHILSGNPGNLAPGGDRKDSLALLFCAVITVFALLFGTNRHLAMRRGNRGLVTAMAFESLIKLGALTALMAVVLTQVFNGTDGLEGWLADNLYPVAGDDYPAREGEYRVLFLLFFAGAVGMPHMFHMVFAENTDSTNLRIASWALPLYLCLLSLPTLPIAWAGVYLDHSLPREYTGLAIGLALESNTVSAIAFVAGLSASSAAIIVVTIALSNMCLYHLVLPARGLRFDRDRNLYQQLHWLRRGLITGFILAGYLVFVILDGRQGLAQLALIAFIGTLQFFPGIVATTYWQGANRIGLLTGLGAGLAGWFTWVVLPAVTGIMPPALNTFSPDFLRGMEPWAAATLLSLFANTTLFILVSLVTRATDEEQVAAEICSMDNVNAPVRQTLAQRNAAEFITQLSQALGEDAARTEVERALQQLQLEIHESRPYALRRVRRRIESNLAGLLGPAVAHNVVDRCLPYRRSPSESREDINLIERNLDRSRVQFTGRAAELNNLRRHYRETLDNLPIGVCASATDGEMTLWNRCMEEITGIDAHRVLGSHLGSLPAPWNAIVDDFLRGEADGVLKQEVEPGPTCSGEKHDGKRWVSLHRAAAAARNGDSDDRVVVVEDITDYELMERELLHSERLASIGRLAAGVAHEIGNPVTGIACLAQNLEYETDPDDIRTTAQDILKQTERVTRIVQSLVNFSHTGSSPGDTVLQPCNLADCVDEAIHLLQLDRQAKAVSFVNRCNRELLVAADSQRLLQVFINVLSNARDACEDGGRIEIDAGCDGERVQVDVEDDGCGIPAEALDRVFEPFYSSKDPGAGTGLGLALVYSIIEDLGGSVQLSSPIHAAGAPGTRVRIRLRRDDYGNRFEA